MTASPTDPVKEGLAVYVDLPVLNSEGQRTGETAETMSCSECGVLVWDVERHWADAHNNRLRALRSIRARGAE